MTRVADLPDEAEPVDPRRQRGREVDERRVEAAGGDREGRVAAEADPHDQRAAELDAAELRVAQPRVDREQPRLDVVVAEEVGGEVDEPRRVDRHGRRDRPDRADHGQPREAEVAAAERAGELGEDPEPRDDERRRRPVDLDDRPDRERVRLDREQRPQPAEDARRVLHRVGREEDVVEGVRARATARSCSTDATCWRPMMPPTAVMREAEADLPRRVAELGVQQQEQRPAGRRRRLRVEQPERLDVRPLKLSSRTPAYSPLSASR